MADDWLGITSANIDSLCGEEGGATLADALDGLDYWDHHASEVHWFILDLGQTYTIKKVRGRSIRTEDPIDVDIYVSDSKTVWGAAVASGINTFQDTNDWVEVDTTDKDGQYIKVVINATEEGSPGELNFGKFGGEGQNIFDAYGDVAGVTHALAGVIAGVAGVSGTVAMTLLVKGAIAGVAGVSGAIARTLVLAGASAGVATAAATLINQKWLAGIITGVASVTGLLTNQKWLAGVVAGKAVVSATLTNIKWLAGVIAGVATVTANLFHVRVAIRVLSAVRNLLALRNIPPVR